MGKKVNLGFRVTEDRQEELKILAARRRVSVQALIEIALDEYLAKISESGERGVAQPGKKS